eukprot:2254942-Pleurochrysis_carterae.AAC.1
MRRRSMRTEPRSAVGGRTHTRSSATPPSAFEATPDSSAVVPTSSRACSCACVGVGIGVSVCGCAFACVGGG